MRFKSVLLVGSCLAALTVSSVALAQDANDVVEANFAALAGTIGIGVVALPDMGTGVYSSGTGNLSPSLDQIAVGIQAGLTLGGVLGQVGDMNVVGNLYAVGTVAYAGGSTVDTFTGPGLLVVQGYSPGSGTIDITTNSGGGVITIDVDVVGDPDNVDFAAFAGTSAATAVTTLGGAFSFAGAAATGGVSAVGYGALADTDGFSFIGVGDLTGLTVTTTANETVIYVGGEATIGLAGQYDERTSVQAYTGPTYRHLNRNIKGKVTIDIPEVAGQPIPFPLMGIVRNEKLTADYYGGMVGMSVSRVLDNGILFTLTGEGGLYGHHFNYSGSESYFLEGPTFTTSSVNSALGASGQNNGIAWFARAQSAVSMGVAQNTILTLGGALEYLSKTPTIQRSQGSSPTVAQAGDDAVLTYTAVPSAISNSILSFGDMWSASVTASLTTQF